MNIPYKLTIAEKPSYLHAIASGPNNKENVLGYLAETLRECSARGCRRLLIEERLDGPRMDAGTVFDIAAEGTARALGHFEAIAFVDVNAESADAMKFAETVAVNRGLPVEVFATVDAAENWLLTDGRAAGAPAGTPRR